MPFHVLKLCSGKWRDGYVNDELERMWKENCSDPSYITITALVSKVWVKYIKPSVRVTFLGQSDFKLRSAVCDT
jgi:hypothetical protein